MNTCESCSRASFTIYPLRRLGLDQGPSGKTRVSLLISRYMFALSILNCGLIEIRKLLNSLLKVAIRGFVLESFGDANDMIGRFVGFYDGRGVHFVVGFHGSPEVVLSN